MLLIVPLKTWFLILLLGCFSIASLSQTTLKGNIYTADSVKLNDCLLKIKKANESAFLHFQSLTGTNQFEVPLNKMSGTDTLEVIASKSGFTANRQRISISSFDFTKPLNIYLSPQGKELKEIVIKPSYWKRGDTTIYIVDSFKTGEEKKLKDIITKLPGFTYTDETLRYKGKVVTKIFIDNEDLFADRTNLLLESFPVHVLSQVEAIENQPVNRLLKGLTSDVETIVNLKVNKEKFKLAFGDADIGLTSNQRFQLNPTLFLLSQKFNLAYAGFNNNLGTNLKSIYENPINQSAASNITLQPASVKTINNFNKSRFLNNRLLNNQITSGYAISKKIKAKSEFTVADEKTKQNSFSKLILLDTSTAFTRNETDSFLNRESLLDFKQTFNISFTKNKNLKILYEYQYNKNTNNQYNIIAKNMINDSVITDQADNTNLHLLQLNYTHRLSENKAFLTTINITGHDNASNRNIYADFLPKFYGISDSSFKNNLQQFNNHFFESKITTEYIRKKDKRINNYYFTYSHSFLQLQNNGYLQKENTTDNSFYLNDYSSAGRYQSDILSFSTGRNYAIKKDNLSWLVEPCINYLSRKETRLPYERKIIPELSALLKFEKRLAKGLRANVSANYINKAVNFTEIQQIVIPGQYNVFQTRNVPLSAVPKLKLQFSIIQARTSGNIFMLSYNFEESYKSLVSQSYFNQFMNLLYDSLIVKSARSNSISTSNTFPVEALNGKIHLSGAYTFRQFFIASNNNEFNKTKNIFAYITLIIESGFAKKYFLYSSNSLILKETKFPPAISNPFNTKVYTLKNSLNQRYNFSKKFSLYVETNLYHFNLTSQNKSRLIFLDADIQYKFKSKYALNVKLENVLNQKEYQIIDNLPLSQSISTIPLMPRNILLAFRVEL